MCDEFNPYWNDSPKQAFANHGSRNPLNLGDPVNVGFRL